MTLYLKYRPQTIEELDLTSVRESLKKVLSSQNIPHAFLFTGPRGAGKTSAARIVAKALNCLHPITNNQSSIAYPEPCNECEQCKTVNAGNHVDIIEMDAASNRGIDDIRALRESVGLSPQSAKKKVYIIDEAHMLTTEAANAFLKTLEEPPSHVQFIFATTDPQKLPETIKSRLHTIQFTKANANEIARQLERVITGEKMNVEDGVVELIAGSVDGSFRDAVKKLEALSLGNEKLTLVEAERYLYQSGDIGAIDVLKLLAEQNCKGALEAIQKYADNGGDMKNLTEQIIDNLRRQILAEFDLANVENKLFSKSDALSLIELMMEARNKVASAHVSQLPLEIAIVKWTKESPKEVPKKVDTPAAHAERGDKIPVKEAESEPPETEKKVISSPVEDLLEKKINAMKSGKSYVEVTPVGDGDTPKQVWAKILAQAKNTNTTVEALLRAAELVDYNGEGITLGVYYQFHKERLEAGKNRELLDTIVQHVCGPVKVSLMLTQPKMGMNGGKNTVHTDTLTETSDEDIIQAAKEIFGE